MNREELLAQMEKLAAAGDEKAYEAFIIEHFKELPEEVQGKVLFGFFSETVDRQANEKATELLQLEGLKALEELERIKAEATQGKQ